MSFQDIEAGGVVPRGVNLANAAHDASHAVASGVFQINTAVSSFTRLTNQLGTVKDTPELREKLRKARQHIMQLANETSAKLKLVTEVDHAKPVSQIKKIGDAKLAKDFETVLKLFEKAQRMFVEREASCPPLDAQTVFADESFSSNSPELERRSLLAQQKRQEMYQIENEITFNEAVIEERAQGIREVHEQIEEVHEMFKDLASMVQHQDQSVIDIHSHIENTYANTVQANRQLDIASGSQKSGNYLSCLLLVIFGAALVIVIIVLAA